MTELEFIPLKTPEGKVCGHARIAGGYAEVRLRAPLAGRVAVLTATGVTEGPAGGRIAVRGADARVQAVVVHEDGRVRCMGLSRGASLAPEQVRARLMTSHRAAGAPQADVAVQAPAVSRRAAEAIPSAGTEAPPAIPAAAPAAPVAADIAQTETPATTATAATGMPVERQDPAEAPDASAARAATVPAAAESGAAQTAEGGAQATAMNARPATTAESAQPQQSSPAAAVEISFTPVENREPSAPPSIEQSAADSESFMALLRRADAAFQRISRRNGPMPGADMLPDGAFAPHARRSSRHGDAVQERKTPTAAPGAPEHAPAVQTAAMRPSAAAPVTGEATSRRAHRLPGEAAGWSDEVDRLLEDCEPRPRREPIANPFPNIFPGAGFYRVSLPGQSAHLEGDWQRGGERVQITAVPGAYSPRPPAHLPDFTRYIRARSGGYWIRIRPAVRED
jgi:hypothetical protein